MPKPIKAEQRSPEWFEARLGRATASKFADIMATTRNGYSMKRNNYATELALERLTGQQLETYTSAPMQWGIENEDTASLMYSLKTGNEVEQTSLWVHDELMAGASPDGLVGDDGVIEIKCPNSATHLNTLVTGKIPSQYIAQVQGQMWITGRKWCDFISYDPRMPENAQMIIVHVKRDDDYIEGLHIEVREFLEQVEEQVEFIKDYRVNKSLKGEK